MSRVSPHGLTAVATGAGLAAGVAFALAGRGAWVNGLAAALIVVSGACDALDGLVARLHARATRLGDFLDHFGDRLIEIAVLGGIAVSPGATPALGAAVLIATLLHSYLGTQIEATFGRRSYDGPGKAEQVVALAAYATARLIWPEAAFTVGAWSVSLPDAFLAGLGAVTLAGMGFRLRRAFALGLGAGDGPGGPNASWR